MRRACDSASLRDACAGGRDALRAGPAGLLRVHAGRSTDRMGCKCDIVPLDPGDGEHGGPTVLMHNRDGHRGPAPLHPGACNWGHEPATARRESDWDRWSLYTAGLDNSGCVIRLHRTGQKDCAGLTRVGTGGRSLGGSREPERDGPGPRCTVIVVGICRFTRSRPFIHQSFTRIHDSRFKEW